MIQVKIFSDYAAYIVERMANAWLESQGDNIGIINIKFSSSIAVDQHGVKWQNYSIMIQYVIYGEKPGVKGGEENK